MRTMLEERVHLAGMLSQRAMAHDRGHSLLPNSFTIQRVLKSSQVPRVTTIITLLYHAEYQSYLAVIQSYLPCIADTCKKSMNHSST